MGTPPHTDTEPSATTEVFPCSHSPLHLPGLEELQGEQETAPLLKAMQLLVLPLSEEKSGYGQLRGG